MVTRSLASLFSCQSYIILKIKIKNKKMKRGVKIALIVIGVFFAIALAFFIWWIVSLLNLTKHSIHDVFAAGYSKKRLDTNGLPFTNSAVFIVLNNVNRENLSSFMKRIRQAVAKNIDENTKKKTLAHADAQLANEFDLKRIEHKVQTSPSPGHASNHRFEHLPIWIESEFLDSHSHPNRHKIHVRQLNPNQRYTFTHTDIPRASIAIRVKYHDKKTSVQEIEKRLNDHGFTSRWIL